MVELSWGLCRPHAGPRGRRANGPGNLHGSTHSSQEATSDHMARVAAANRHYAIVIVAHEAPPGLVAS